MTGGLGRSARPHTGARGSLRDLLAVIERASEARLKCSERDSVAFGASISAAC